MRLPREILKYGPDALLLNWEQGIDPDINIGVHAYAHAIETLPDVQECVLAYCSLLVRFNPNQTTAYRVQEAIYALEVKPEQRAEKRLFKVPVVYGGEHGPDLEEVAQKLKLSPAKVIKLHTAVSYRVYQLGYQPGFPFLGLTDPKLEVSRRDDPRARVAAGSVGLAGRQTGIYPHEAPGGWQIIGRCPWNIWRNDGVPNALFRPGDEVQFQAIKATEWEAASKKQSAWPDK